MYAHCIESGVIQHHHTVSTPARPTGVFSLVCIQPFFPALENGGNVRHMWELWWACFSGWDGLQLVSQLNWFTKSLWLHSKILGTSQFRCSWGKDSLSIWDRSWLCQLTFIVLATVGWVGTWKACPFRGKTWRDSWPCLAQWFQTQFWVDRGDKKRISRQYLSTLGSMCVYMYCECGNRAIQGQGELKKTCTLNSFCWDFNLQMQIGGRYSRKGKISDRTVKTSDVYRINNIINLHFITVAVVIAERTF